MLTPPFYGHRWLLICICFLPCIVTAYSQESLVPVTARFAVSKKARHHNYRLQLLPSKDSVAVMGYGFTRLTKSLKALRFQSMGKVKRTALEASADASLDSAYHFNTHPEQKLTFNPPAAALYEKQKLRFLAGKHASGYFSSQWIRFASIPIDSTASLAFETRGVFKSHHYYAMDFLPGAMAWAFPAIDPWHCSPATLDLIKLRKLQGYGVDNIRYIPYNPTSRMIIRNSFDVYFPYNEATPDARAMERIIKYLDQNAFVILNAELEGGCSAEGSVDRNQFLQQQRAAVVQKTLHRYADELIKKDTVLFTDELLQFRQLIRTNFHQFKALDTLSDEALRERINTNSNLKKALEPVFVLQRKASLKLVMAKRLTREEQFSKFVSDLNKAVSIWHNTRHETPEGEQRVMGMIDKLFTDFEQRNISEQEVNELIDETSYPAYLRVLIGYHLLKKFEERKQPRRKTWNEYWQENNVGQWLETGQNSLLELIISTSVKEKRSKYLRMLNDYQTYRYEFVEMGLIDVSTLCHIPYPETSEFMGLILSQYAYLYETVKRTGVAIQCIPQRKAAPAKDSITNTDKFIDDILQKNETRTYALIGDRLIKRKSFDQSPKSAYYFFLKQHYVKNNKSVLDNVSYQNSGAAVELNAFNLAHLIDMNVAAWDPFENHFYDEEVQLDEMSKLIGLMHSIDKRICRPQINDLYLEYYLKALYYLERYHEPGNPKHAKYADAALKFIGNYYESRAKVITPRLAMHIARQMNLFNWLPGTQHGARYGYEILTAISKERMLSEDEIKLYAHYLKLFNPEMKRLPSISLDKEKLAMLMAEGY